MNINRTYKQDREAEQIQARLQGLIDESINQEETHKLQSIMNGYCAINEMSTKEVTANSDYCLVCRFGIFCKGI